MKKKVTRISVAIGLILFCFVVYKIGPMQIWENIEKISVQNLLILFFLRFLYWLLRTINWKMIINQFDGEISLLQLFKVRIYSHAVSHLTPSAQLGGEAARVMMVGTSSRRISIASVVVDKTIEYLTTIFFTIIAAAMIITRIPKTGKITTVFICFVILGPILLFFFIYRQKKGLFIWIINLMRKLRIKIKFLEKNLDKIEETDKYISDFYNKHRSTFLKVFLLYSLLILLWTTEIYLTLIFIGATDITFLDSFLITTLGTLAFLFPLIPGALGIYEVTYVSIFAILRLGTHFGLTLVLIRRIVALMWAGIGLLGIIKHPPAKEEI